MISPDWVPALTSISCCPSKVSRLNFGAQGGRRHGNVEGCVQVVAVADVGGVVVDADLHVQVAGGAAGRARLALAGQLDPGAGGDAGRDLDGQRTAAADAALAAALVAGVLDDGAEAFAGAAGCRRHDLAQDGPDGPLDLAAAAADVAAFGVAALRQQEPSQVGQVTAVSTSSFLLTPNTASRSSIRTLISASWPRRTRDAGPAGPPAPKKVSKMSWKAKPWPA